MDEETLELMTRLLTIIALLNSEAPKRQVCEATESLFFKLHQKRHELHKVAMAQATQEQK
jgi:hypothetical protein